MRVCKAACTASLGFSQGITPGQTCKGLECRGDCGDNRSPAVSAKAVFEEASELGVAVRDVGPCALCLSQSRYDVAERAERGVDLLALL